MAKNSNITYFVNEDLPLFDRTAELYEVLSRTAVLHA